MTAIAALAKTRPPSAARARRAVGSTPAECEQVRGEGDVEIREGCHPSLPLACAAVGGAEQRGQRNGIEAVPFLQPRGGHRDEESGVLAQNTVHTRTLHGGAADGGPQFDEVVRGGHHHDQPAARPQDARALGWVAARVHREDDIDGSIRKWQTPIRVGDNPGRRGAAACGAHDRGAGELEADGIHTVDTRDHLCQELAGSGPELGHHTVAVAEPGSRLPHDTLQRRDADTAREQPLPRRDRIRRIARQCRAAILRLQQIHISGAGDVERMPVLASPGGALRYEWTSAAAHWTGKAGSHRRHRTAAAAFDQAEPPPRQPSREGEVPVYTQQLMRGSTTPPDPSETSPEPIVRRSLLIAQITRFLSDRDAQTLGAMRASLEREIDAAGPAALVELGERLAKAGSHWGYNPRDPLARRIHYVLAERILQPDSALIGIEHARQVAGQPVVIFANHLSYSDANVLEVLLTRSGLELADRLTVVAGPKVYSNAKRRFSSLCFGTIKTPQSSARSSEDAVMNQREVARAARQSIDMAHERLGAGDALLVFGEGTRSRTHELQPMLAGASRYIDVPGTWVLPVGIVGSEEMYPIGDDTLYPVRIVISVGRPVDAQVLRERANGDRRVMMDAVGLAVAALLPPAYRGAYQDGASLGDAQDVFADLWG